MTGLELGMKTVLGRNKADVGMELGIRKAGKGLELGIAL